MLILWMSFPAFLLQLPLTSSAPISSRLAEKSGNYCRRTQMSSLQTVFQPLKISMEFSMICAQSLVLQFLPEPAVWILGSWHPPRRSFSRWRKPVLFDVLLLLGLALSTWFLNLMVPGDPVVILDTSTPPLFLTDTLCQLLRISLPE